MGEIITTEQQLAIDKTRREMKEFLTQFKDAKNPRQMWQTLSHSAVCRKAIKPIKREKFVKDEGYVETEDSQIERGVYDSLVEQYGEDNVTEKMMMDACQAYLSRTASSSYISMRDSSGAKPVDESKMGLTAGHNPFEALDNEQLAAVAKALEEVEAERQRQLKSEEEVK